MHHNHHHDFILTILYHCDHPQVSSPPPGSIGTSGKLCRQSQSQSVNLCLQNLICVCVTQVKVYRYLSKWKCIGISGKLRRQNLNWRNVCLCFPSQSACVSQIKVYEKIILPNLQSPPTGSIEKIYFEKTIGATPMEKLLCDMFKSWIWNLEFGNATVRYVQKLNWNCWIWSKHVAFYGRLPERISSPFSHLTYIKLKVCAYNLL